MHINTFVRSRRRVALAGTVVFVVTALTALALVAGTAQGSNRDTITLHVGLFGDFGYHDLYKQFEAAHPNIDIKEDISSYADHHANLAKHLAVNSGADDIEAVEVGFISQFKSQPRYFYDLKKYGAGGLSSRWLSWKWRQSIAPNGAQIGLGTDVGSLAICYRRDLFKKAGLPTNRNAVSKLWPTWQRYFAVGKRFTAHAPRGVRFFDSGSNVFNAMIGQLNPAYYASNGKVIVGSNPTVKQAWAITTKAVQAHESAGLAAFSNDWNTGYKKGKFATVTCPAWMMGYIQGQAPKTKGKWDIASVPGGRGGNWGGSFLTIPRQSSHPKEAYQLAAFLTSPAAEAAIFKQTGNLPSQPALLKSKSVQGFKNPFFSNAPVGKIFAGSALELKPQTTGPHQGDIQTAVTNAIQRVEQKKQSPGKAWKQFLKDVQNVA